MDNFLKYILEQIVNHKEEVKIERQDESPSQVLFKVFLNEEDKGIVIGAGGRNINAIRNMINIIGKREGKKVYIKIED